MSATYSYATLKNSQPDVLSYHLMIEPNINDSSIKGTVVIIFEVKSDIDTVTFQAGNLEIFSISGNRYYRF